jgi:O-antigen/teichoic acid export membrane protein
MAGKYLTYSLLGQVLVSGSWSYIIWSIPTEEIGKFAILTFICDIISRLISVGMESAIVRFCIDDKNGKNVFSSVTVSLIIGMISALLILFSTINLVSDYLVVIKSIYRSVVGLVFLVAAVSAVANCMVAFYVGQRRVSDYGKTTLLRNVVLVIGYTITARFNFQIEGLLISQAIASVSVVLIFCFSNPLRINEFQVEEKLFKKMLNYGLPMLGYSIASTVCEYSSRIALGTMVGTSSTGIYLYYFQIYLQISAIWGSVNRAWNPYMFNQITHSISGSRDKINQFCLVAGISSASAMVALIIGADINAYKWFIPAKYLNQIALLYIMMTAFLLSGFYTAVYPCYYYPSSTLKVSLVQLFLNVVGAIVSYFITQKFGVEGASVSIPICCIISLFGHWLFHPECHDLISGCVRNALFWCFIMFIVGLAVILKWESCYIIAVLLLGIADSVVKMFSLKQNVQTPK